jgi:hypothetical protein
MSGHVVASVVTKPIIVEFLTNEDVKPAEFLLELRAEFDYGTLPRIRVYKYSKSFKEGRTEVENERRLYLLQGMLWQVFFGTLKDSHRFSDDTKKHQRMLLF